VEKKKYEKPVVSVIKMDVKQSVLEACKIPDFTGGPEGFGCTDPDPFIDYCDELIS
jgi:hypothetical protein